MVLQFIVNGLIYGGILSLAAVGLTISYGILNFANFAYGEYMAAGAYFALFFAGFMPFYLAVPCAMVAACAAGIAIQKLVYDRLAGRDPIHFLIASIGLSLVIKNLIQIIFGPDSFYYWTEIEYAMELPFGVRIKQTQLLIIALCVLIMALLHLFLHRTIYGKMLRAVADNPSLAEVVGIDLDRATTVTWVISCLLATISGIFLGIENQLRPDMCVQVLLPIFAAVILGGVGSPRGAILGGMIIGVVQELSVLVLDPSYKQVSAFVIMIVILLVRPQGILGEKRRWS